IMIGLSQLFLFAICSAWFLGTDIDFLLGSSAILATAIGFASTSVAANIVGGLYIIFTRPFGVGDFIKTQGKEGIVLEVGLNYTKIMQLDRTVLTIPNSNLLNASILNFTVSIVDEIERREEAKKLNISSVSITVPELVAQIYHDTFDVEEIIRFVKKIELKLNACYPPLQLTTVKKRLDEVSAIFTTVFGFPIRYYFGKHIFRQDTYIIITANDVNTVFDNYSSLMESIMESVFIEMREEEK
ncbi:MAG: mechanosensitive ion channel domain-containing protein, partial [Candidatus Hodarchaeales archaeon]